MNRMICEYKARKKPRRPNPGTKSWSNFSHARNKAWERYSLSYTLEDEREITKLIKLGKSTGVRTSNNRTVHTLPYAGKIIRVVYDKARKGIITFLPAQELNDDFN